MTETWLQPLKYVCLTGLPAVHIHMSSTEKCSSDHESKKNHIMVKNMLILKPVHLLQCVLSLSKSIKSGIS